MSKTAGVETSKAMLLKPNISEASTVANILPTSLEQPKQLSEFSQLDKSQKRANFLLEHGVYDCHTGNGGGEELGKKSNVGNGSVSGKQNGAAVCMNGAVQSHNGGR